MTACCRTLSKIQHPLPKYHTALALPSHTSSPSGTGWVRVPGAGEWEVPKHCLPRGLLPQLAAQPPSCMSGESKTTHRKSGKQLIISQHCSHLIQQAVSDGDFIDDWLSVEIKSCNFNLVVTKINVTDFLVCLGWNPGRGFFSRQHVWVNTFTTLYPHWNYKCSLAYWSYIRRMQLVHKKTWINFHFICKCNRKHLF